MEQLFEEMIRVNMLEHEVIYHTMKSFKMLRDAAKRIEEKFESKYPENNMGFDVNKSSEYVFEVSFGSDVLAFICHPDVYCFPKNHETMRLPYVTENKSNSYCGVIEIYNFLSESFQLNKLDDSGALIGRVYVNREGHFYVEGVRELAGFLSRFGSEVFSIAAAEKIIESSIEVALHYDMFVPEISELTRISIDSFMAYRDKMMLRSGKKIGFE
ncbi:MAG: hypothetical protein IKW93_02405 [Bacteroidales bacterium]|nr:hypothetical protein [Bacteroidales bacterium]